jgi:hypothetical protein
MLTFAEYKFPAIPSIRIRSSEREEGKRKAQLNHFLY